VIPSGHLQLAFASLPVALLSLESAFVHANTDGLIQQSVVPADDRRIYAVRCGTRVDSVVRRRNDLLQLGCVNIRSLGT